MNRYSPETGSRPVKAPGVRGDVPALPAAASSHPRAQVHLAAPDSQRPGGQQIPGYVLAKSCHTKCSSYSSVYIIHRLREKGTRSCVKAMCATDSVFCPEHPMR